MRPLRPSGILAFLLLLVVATPLSAATVTWTGATSGAWSDGTNWSTGSAPTGADDLVFPVLAANPAMTNDIAGLTPATMAFQGSYTLSGSAIAPAAIVVSGAASTVTISAPISVTGALAISVTDATAVLDIASVITGTSGSDAVTISGPGEVRYSSASSMAYLGTTTVNSGRLVLNSSGGIGIPGNLTIGNGTDAATVSLATAPEITDLAIVTVNANGVLDLSTTVGSEFGATERINGLAGAGSVLLGSGVVLGLHGNSGVATVPASSTFSGTISGAGGIAKTGTGNQRLTGTSTYTGPTTVSGGELRIMGDQLATNVTVTAQTLGLTDDARVGTVTSSGTSAIGVGAEGTGAASASGLSISGSSARLDIFTKTAGTPSTLTVTGPVAITGATLRVDTNAGGLPPVGTTTTIVANDGTDPVSGTFTGIAEGGTVTSTASTAANIGTFTVSYVGGDGNDIAITRTSGGSATSGATTGTGTAGATTGGTTTTGGAGGGGGGDDDDGCGLGGGVALLALALALLPWRRRLG